MSLDRFASPPVRSLRHNAAPRLRVLRRDEGDGPASVEIVGHASVFNQTTTLYEGRYFVWREVVRPGAFARAIREKQDVRSLLNHDANFVLGRTVSGTLSLSEDDVGLLSRTFPPGTQTIRDLVISPIERGDMSGMSFAFTPSRGEKIVQVENADGSTVVESGGMRTTIRYEGERRIEEDEILDVDLFDVSPVTYPAYSGTDVALRSRPDLSDLIRRMDVPHVRPVKTPRLDLLRARLSTRGASPRGR